MTNQFYTQLVILLMSTNAIGGKSKALAKYRALEDKEQENQYSIDSLNKLVLVKTIAKLIKKIRFHTNQ
ncbi:MAG: hypothetical protein ACQJCO_05010 [cyanobacterium endosymbiont of Rhopalodia sterrenbergii]